MKNNKFLAQNDEERYPDRADHDVSDYEAQDFRQEISVKYPMVKVNYYGSYVTTTPRLFMSTANMKFPDGKRVTLPTTRKFTSAEKSQRAASMMVMLYLSDGLAVRDMVMPIPLELVTNEMKWDVIAKEIAIKCGLGEFKVTTHKECIGDGQYFSRGSAGPIDSIGLSDSEHESLMYACRHFIHCIHAKALTGVVINYAVDLDQGFTRTNVVVSGTTYSTITKANDYDPYYEVKLDMLSDRTESDSFNFDGEISCDRNDNVYVHPPTQLTESFSVTLGGAPALIAEAISHGDHFVYNNTYVCGDHSREGLFHSNIQSHRNIASASEVSRNVFHSTGALATPYNLLPAPFISEVGKFVKVSIGDCDVCLRCRFPIFKNVASGDYYVEKIPVHVERHALFFPTDGDNHLSFLQELMLALDTASSSYRINRTYLFNADSAVFKGVEVEKGDCTIVDSNAIVSSIGKSNSKMLDEESFFTDVVPVERGPGLVRVYFGKASRRIYIDCDVVRRECNYYESDKNPVSVDYDSVCETLASRNMSGGKPIFQAPLSMSYDSTPDIMNMAVIRSVQPFATQRQQVFRNTLTYMYKDGNDGRRGMKKPITKLSRRRKSDSGLWVDHENLQSAVHGNKLKNEQNLIGPNGKVKIYAPTGVKFVDPVYDDSGAMDFYAMQNS